MNLDGYALPIKKLKGTEPIESLDLSGKNLGVASTIVIASLISVNGSLTSLNLGNNQLCGLDQYGDGTYTAKGITAIADALCVSGSLTSLNLGNNQLCGLDQYGDGTYTAKGITAIADALCVSGSLTSLDIHCNNIVGDGAAKLSAAVLGNLKIEMFNELPIKEMRADSFTELDLKWKFCGVEGAMVVAGLIPVMGVLTKME